MRPVIHYIGVRKLIEVTGKYDVSEPLETADGVSQCRPPGSTVVTLLSKLISFVVGGTDANMYPQQFEGTCQPPGRSTLIDECMVERTQSATLPPFQLCLSFLNVQYPGMSVVLALCLCKEVKPDNPRAQFYSGHHGA